MRIGVLRTQVPFVTGGAERHAANLCEALNRHGHEAVEITLPFKWYPGEVLASHILAAKMLDLSEVEGVPVDLTIGLKFPAYLAPHPNKAFWIIHQHRQAYDMWSLGNSDLLQDPDGEALRQLIMSEDRAAFAATTHPIFTNSRNVSSRLNTYLGLGSTPLYHPPPQAERMIQGGYGDYIFAPGRINPSKRLELILRGLAQAPGVRLVVAGVAENPAYQQQLHALAQELGVAGRVDWLGRVDDATLLRNYAEARAVVFVPQDEDYGYITLEAMLAGKAVITVADAGGPLEFITHEQQGLVVRPTPEDLGTAFEQVMQDKAAAERWGQAGSAHYRAMNINWDHVVEQLTGTKGSMAAAVSLPPAARTPEDVQEERNTEEVDPQQKATAELEAAIAPPSAPSDFPFASVSDVLEAYELEELPRLMGEADKPINPELAAYLGTHWTRFLATLDLIGDDAPQKVLDVGVFPPLVFQAMLANRYPGIEMTGLWEGPYPYAQQVRSRSAEYPGFDITLSPANTERDRWPFPDESFDTVTAMEILEHLALDPYFFFSEAARVLKPGGRLVVTTPNVVSHRGVWKMLNGIAPYSFGIFVPTGGVYGRHNREYAPPEVAELAQAAGFETARLQTFDVYDRHIDPGTAELLAVRGDNLALRGETIFYLGRKASPPTGAPARLYYGDAQRMAATFHVGAWDDETGLLRLGLTNESSLWWNFIGPHATCILAEWVDEDGMLRHQHVFQPITDVVQPGETHEFKLLLDPANQRENIGQLRLHAYQAGGGTFVGTGRSAPIVLPCSRTAFLNLARTAPRLAEKT